MKNLIAIAVLFLSISLSAQQYVDKKGMAHFFSAATVENIEATTHSAVCALNTSTKRVVAKIPVTSFVFPDKLMQEHFNENYLESDKYAYASLDGTISEPIDFTKDGTYDVTIKGTFDIHNVKVNKEVKGKLTIKNGVPVSALAKFDVKLADHKIKIPSLLGANIAESEAVNVEFNFEKYEKK